MYLEERGWDGIMCIPPPPLLSSSSSSSFTLPLFLLALHVFVMNH